jgi:hypothetical protein
MTMLKKTALVCTTTALVLAAGLAQAAVSADKAAQLGGKLTPVGAEKAGNAAGTIPAWEGGITRAPAGYKAGQFHPDPFASDKPLFTITAANYKQYAEQLSEGQEAMFAKYPNSFKMVVYPTRRSASFPARTYEYTKKNATSCKLVADGEGVAGCAEGFPFPIPGNAKELIWNHKLKYKGLSVSSFSNQVAPTAGGAFTLIKLQEQVLGLYYKPGNTTESINNILLYFKQEVLGPARLAGQVLLVHETLNAKAQPRQAWVYNPGQRRVRRAPNVAYDNPGTASDGLRTNDMTDMFNGAMDRFEWTLVGKKEMYVPYNSYVAHSNQTKIKDLIRPGHLNPDKLRYELHRVWVVEAKLKPGQRHINSRRTFYLDEDSYQILVLDHYDGQGKLWRYSEAPSVNYYEVPTFWATLETHHDLKSGRYIVGYLDNEDKVRNFGFQSTPSDYSPQNLRNSGVR